MTNLTSRARAWSDRVLLTPVLRVLALPFQWLWATSAALGLRVWRWLLRPLWRRAARPVVWLPLRWTGLRVWRWLLRPLWRRAARPAWSLLRWAWALLLTSPSILARTLPNRGWLPGAVVLALTAAVLLVPGVVNAKTPDRLSQVTRGAGVETLGALRPEISMSFASFAGWGLEPSDAGRREFVLKRDQSDEAVLRVVRQDGVQNAEERYRWYVGTKLGVRDPGYLNPRRISAKDARGTPVEAVQINQYYHVENPENHDLDRFHQVVLFNYGTTVLFLVLSTSGREPKPLTNEMRDLLASVRITP